MSLFHGDPGWLNAGYLVPAATTLLVAVGAIVGGTFAYGRQKLADRKHQMILERRTVYRKYLKSLDLIFQAVLERGWDGIRQSFVDQSEIELDMVVFASDSVLRTMISCRDTWLAWSSEVIDKDIFDFAESPLYDPMRESTATLVLAMRKDCFADDGLSHEWAMRSLPYLSEDSVSMEGKMSK